MERRSILRAILIIAVVAPGARAQGPACCDPVRIVATGGVGTLTAGTFIPLPLGAGIVMRIDVGPADASCRHGAIVPSGGFAVPAFCLPALNATADIFPRACTGGAPEGVGAVWDGHATCADADVSARGDTHDDMCDVHLLPCKPGGIANNTRGKLDVMLGNGACDAVGVHAQLDIPARGVVWLDGDASADCPDEDGVYDPGTDTLIHEFNTILTFTTASATAAFADTNGDACFREGVGPNGPITVSGSPAAGPCCVPGQTLTLTAAEVVLSGQTPMNDYLLRLKLPMTVTTCEPWPGSASCTLPSDEGCEECPPLRKVDLPRLYDPNWRLKDWWGPVKRWGPMVVGIGGNIFYVPAKVGFAAVGTVATSLTYVATLGSAHAADAVWRASTGGDYVITPQMVKEGAPIAFVGS